MNRTKVSFPVKDFQFIKQQMLSWSNQFNICCFLDSHEYQEPHSSYECLLGAGALRFIEASPGNALTKLQAFTDHNRDWIFGHFSYDLKNETEEGLHSSNSDGVKFPDLFFFVPEIVVLLAHDEISILCDASADAEKIFNDISGYSGSTALVPAVNVHSKFSRDEYISTIKQLQAHILRGDCYEINFCQEFYATSAIIDPVATYFSLSTLSPNPFAAFYKLHERYLLCGSPERYMKKEGNHIFSQPMKGTWQRSTSREEDAKNKRRLENSEKDKSENVMVVDLVRNDLSKVCEEGTVHVEDLFKVYSFPNVHQMISSVHGELKAGIQWTDIIRNTFPMGSMTGAPKRKVMELIERYEQTKRGIFSGAIGYLHPSGDFDFNVIIRSIMYNAGNRYLSFQAGSGITFYSDAEKEYEECLLKAAAIKKVLA